MKSNLALVFGALFATVIGTSFATEINVTWLAIRRKSNENEAAIRNANAPYTWGL